MSADVESERRVELADGTCHVSIGGPTDGRPVLLIHGATVGAWIFDRVVGRLHAAGLRTVRPDLFGHGASDRPRARYDHALFERQLVELLDALGVGCVDVIGHSLGAAVAAGLAHRHPERVGRLLASAPLVDFTRNAPLLRWVRVRGLGDVLMPLVVLPLLRRRRARRWGAIEGGRFVRLFERQLERPGFGRALKSMLRAGTLGDQRARYRELGRQARSILVVRGELDEIVHADQIEELQTLLPRAELRELPGLSHSMLLADPAVVADCILEFLSDGRPVGAPARTESHP